MEIILKNPIWVKGKGMPKNGICLFNAGETVKVIKENSQHFILGFYKGKPIKVATIIT